MPSPVHVTILQVGVDHVLDPVVEALQPAVGVPVHQDLGLLAPIKVAPKDTLAVAHKELLVVVLACTVSLSLHQVLTLFMSASTMLANPKVYRVFESFGDNVA